MYELTAHTWKTPGGHILSGFYRADTNDWNTAWSIAIEDEYHLAGKTLTGLVLDVGGYMGTFGLCAALDNPGCSVVIVEPVPENQELIRRNIAANGLGERVTLVCGAVGKGPVSVDYGHQDNIYAQHHTFVGNSSGTFFHADQPHQSVTYEGLRIADLVPFTATLKIDCEGGEWAFLADPDVAKLTTIVGERHPEGGTREDFRRLLAPTHDVTFTGPEAGPDEFTATLRYGWSHP